MSPLNNLLKTYRQHHVHRDLPWPDNLAGPQRVWFAVYPPEDERRLRTRLAEFEIATKEHGRGWRHVDLTDVFARWMATHPYREAYFQNPSLIGGALEGFHEHITQLLERELNEADSHTVVAVTGAASLYGLTKVSRVVSDVASGIRGRLLLFFPGTYTHQSYHLLGVGDGWNYLSIPITV
ncbi:hypothetical protein HNR42_002790 [Deinobacterium chartae]|uniref:DUF1788 domain-containing protein n=1 Tax=Deinobacterium chartae TaxID=521158 RepID=A0A841I4Z0_9DEIO|nr:DUF1788 domain-containing protein [Deinobacterium chartae]MBB6099349.1 hypothetical protein [Deinobacterium chartae]